MSDRPKTIRAEDQKCCECGAQAVCFWPVIDPDIASKPYCRPCVEWAKIDLLMKLDDEDLLGH